MCLVTYMNAEAVNTRCANVSDSTSLHFLRVERKKIEAAPYWFTASAIPTHGYISSYTYRQPILSHIHL